MEKLGNVNFMSSDQQSQGSLANFAEFVPAAPVETDRRVEQVFGMALMSEVDTTYFNQGLVANGHGRASTSPGPTPGQDSGMTQDDA